MARYLRLAYFVSVLDIQDAKLSFSNNTFYHGSNYLGSIKFRMNNYSF